MILLVVGLPAGSTWIAVVTLVSLLVGIAHLVARLRLADQVAPDEDSVRD